MQVRPPARPSLCGVVWCGIMRVVSCHVPFRTVQSPFAAPCVRACVFLYVLGRACVCAFCAALRRQHDGNFVIYAGECCSGTEVWATNTSVREAQRIAISSSSNNNNNNNNNNNSDSNDDDDDGSRPRNLRAMPADPVRMHGADASDFVLATTTNHDYFVGNRGFFFDLSVWDDEVGGGLVGWLVGWLVGRSVGWLVSW